MSLRILFFGSDRMALSTLRAMYNRMSSASGIVCNLELVCCPDRPLTKSTGQIKFSPLETKAFAIEKDLRIHQVPREIGFNLKGWEFPEGVKERQFDLGVVASFGYFIPAHLVTAFPLGMINLHPSMLPKYRGAAPIQRALMNGEKRTGVSVIDIASKMDTGSILLQKSYEIPRDATFPRVLDELSNLGSDAVVETVENINAFRRKGGVVQDQCKATSAPKVKKSEGFLNCSVYSAEQMYNRWRALTTSIPLFMMLKGKRMNVIKVTDPIIVENDPESMKMRSCDIIPGRIVGHSSFLNTLVVQCHDGSLLGIEQLQFAGKRPMDAKAFRNGYFEGSKTPSGLLRFD